MSISAIEGGDAAGRPKPLVQANDAQSADERRDDDILRAVGFAAEQFQRSASWEDCIADVLARLGSASRVSRVYIFQNSTRQDGELLMTETHEWVAPGITTTIEDPENHDRPYGNGCARYVDVLGRGGVIQGLAREFLDPEREDLEAEDIIAVAVVPVFVGDSWWGMMGFDECRTERAWRPAEIEAMKVAASTLGAAIRRRDLETRYRTLVEQIPAVTYIAGFGATGDWMFISPQIESIVGYTPAEWRAHPEPFATHLHPEDRQRVLAEEARCDATGEPLRCEYRLLARDGRVVWIRDQAVLVRDQAGRPMFWQGVMDDITDRKRTEQQLQQAEVSYRALVERIPAIVYRTPDEPGAPYTYISPQVESMLGFTPEEWLVDRSLWQSLLHPEDRDRVLREDERTDHTNEPFEIEYRLLTRDGREVWVRDEAVVIEDAEGTRFWHGVMLDITERKRAEEQAAFLAYHDKLTGLPNRAMFEELLELAMARAKRHGLAVAVLCMDLDNFKLVNDSLGHEAGDQLLRQMAARLREANRQTDLVARQGGDEFLLLLGDLETGDSGAIPDTLGGPRFMAESIAGRIHEALRAPFTLFGTELFVSSSIGVSVFPYDAADARAMLRGADTAMYRSKRSGPGGTGVFSMDAGDPLRQLSFTTRLRKAVERGDWVLHYQPIVDLARTETLGVEALLRWNDPEHGLVLPGEFIPLAEEMGLLETIGDWSLHELFGQAKLWREQGLVLEVGFNLSPRQLWQPGLAEKIRRCLRDAGIDPARVVVEITESTAMADPSRTQRILDSLHQDGIRIAIDDFGTGYSSLSRLKDLSVDILKIDRSFVNDLPDDREAGSMVNAMIQLAESLGMVSLAEGIETAGQWRFLLDRGCRLGQGFYFSRPVPAAEIPDKVRPLRDGTTG